ncbi:GDSL-type esterase/lipase family protein [Elusimicrobiota bacterium]
MKNKWKTIILRIVLVIVGIELGLRAADFSYVLYFNTIKRHIYAVNDKAYKIICIGESTVAGHGAGGFKLGKKYVRQAFPFWVGRLLREKYPDKNIQVFNLGVYAITQEEILKNIRSNLDYFDPDLVILLSGENPSPEPVLPLFYNLKYTNPMFKFAVFMNNMKILRLATLMKYYLKAMKTVDITPAFRMQEIGNCYYTIYRHDIIKHSVKSRNEAMYNIKKIVNIIKKRQPNVVICNYFYSEINEKLKKIAHEYKLSFCDNSRIYNEFLKENKQNEIISEDGWHPNGKGYYLIAENICNTIIENNMIENN